MERARSIAAATSRNGDVPATKTNKPASMAGILNIKNWQMSGQMLTGKFPLTFAIHWSCSHLRAHKAMPVVCNAESQSAAFTFNEHPNEMASRRNITTRVAACVLIFVNMDSLGISSSSSALPSDFFTLLWKIEWLRPCSWYSSICSNDGVCDDLRRWCT